MRSSCLRPSITSIFVLLLVLAPASFAMPLQHDGCEPEFTLRFPPSPGVDGPVLALEVFNDGSGETLYAAGYFDIASNLPAKHVARWNGSTWEEVGGGVNDLVFAFTVFDDGTGPALIAGGEFTEAGGQPALHVAKWDGEQWSPMGDGFNDVVRALIVYDDGNGPALYAGGDFTFSGDELVRWFAKWNGESWEPVPDGPTGDVHVFEIFDDGNGPGLYLGGKFKKAGGIVVNRVARWDGRNWSALAQGVGPNLIVLPVDALEVFDDGNGPGLYVGGNFLFASGISAPYVARWDGQSWSALASGVNAPVGSLNAHDTADGPALYVGGAFTMAGKLNAVGIARWDGAQWSSASNGAGLDGSATALTTYELDGRSQLIAGGFFKRADGIDVNYVAALHDEAWHTVGHTGANTNGPVASLEVFDDGDGESIYAGGNFTRASSRAVNRIARWNGDRWLEVGGGANQSVAALQTFDDGTGPALYAGGYFTAIGEDNHARVARWDGKTWSSIGEGFNAEVRCFAIFDDGDGPALYAGGSFTASGKEPVSRIARWDGAQWQSVGEGVNATVLAMTVFDDGSGPALYVGGFFNVAGNVNASHVARWDGENWSEVDGGVNQPVAAMTVADLGEGDALYLGGAFYQAGSIYAPRLARWDGSSWSSPPTGPNSVIYTLATMDDGHGPAVYAGGPFTFVDGRPIRYAARWDGTAWSELSRDGSPVRNDALIMRTAEIDGATSLLIAGGGQAQILPGLTGYVVEYRGCGPTTSPAPLTDFAITLGTLVEGELDDLIESDDQYLRARSEFSFNAEEPNVLELRVGAISPSLEASTLAATIESRLNHPNGAASVRLRNWNTNEFDEVHVYTIGTVEIIETIDGMDAANYIRATDGRIELAHRQVVLATFSALGFDAAIDQLKLTVTN